MIGSWVHAACNMRTSSLLTLCMLEPGGSNCCLRHTPPISSSFCLGDRCCQSACDVAPPLTAFPNQHTRWCTLPIVAMLRNRLPGYASKLACGSLTRAAAALHWLAQSNTADGAPCGCSVPDQLLQLRNFTAPPPTTCPARDTLSITPSSSKANQSRSLATIASPSAAGADIFDRCRSAALMTAEKLCNLTQPA